jgi:hypothetical protein
VSALEAAHAGDNGSCAAKSGRSSKRSKIRIEINKAFGGSWMSYLTCIRIAHVHGRSHREPDAGSNVHYDVDDSYGLYLVPA